MAHKLSVVIITLNEAHNIGRCLKSACQVADEVIVVDSYSTDNTKQICLEYGAKFYEHKFEGYIQQKQYATSLATHEHILSIDADEVLSNELISSIHKVKETCNHDAYTINRLSHYVDRFIKHGHWFPDKKIRLFKKGKGTWIGRNPHDQLVLTNGNNAPVLKGVLYHYTFSSIAEHVKQANNFSEIGSKQLDDQNTFYLFLKAIFSPFWGFWFGYLGKLGFLDGWYGLVIAVISSTETFLKYSKAIASRIIYKHDNIEAKTDIGVSLIISTYNWPAALRKSLESVKRQYLLPNEVIIADDGSTEETRELIELYKKDFPVPLQHSWIEDKGFRLSKSRNEALKKAKYDYIVQIDGDIILHKYFIYDHVHFANKETFVRGSRVLLDKNLSEKIFSSKIISPNVFMHGTTNFFNGLRIPLFQRVFNFKYRSIIGIRGCNMAYWRKDALAVNGYNEEIQGWGREDSEFVARLVNSGKYKRVLRLGGIEYHIYHPEYDRKLLNKNDIILNRTLQQNLIRCDKGIIKTELELA